jgi:hypothetical protein
MSAFRGEADVPSSAGPKADIAVFAAAQCDPAILLSKKPDLYQSRVGLFASVSALLVASRRAGLSRATIKMIGQIYN